MASFTTQQAELVTTSMRGILEEDIDPAERLDKLTWMLMLAKGAVMRQWLVQNFGSKVYSGPFADMQLSNAILLGPHLPNLLGFYEQELHPALERFIARGYKRVINIGCAIGYYAVGLALRMPDVRVDAFDIDVRSQEICRELALLNNVGDRVTVAGEFKGADFSAYAGEKTMLLLDIEGGEKTLLDPELYPALREMDMIVELHDCFVPGISKLVHSRFAATHDFDIVLNRPALFPFTEVFGPGVHVEAFENFVAVWEGRSGGTPWAVMTRKPA
jgi:hypothetical protein